MASVTYSTIIPRILKYAEDIEGDYVVRSCVEIIGSRAFSRCDGMTSISIPNSVTEIHTSAFENCDKLHYVALPSSVKYIGDFAFAKCSSLCRVSIPDSVEKIGFQVFYKCPNLCEPILNSRYFIRLPDKHKGSYRVPDGIKYIADGAFSGCSELTEVFLPNSVIEIGSAAFYNCKKLHNVTFPASISKIGREAFAQCESLCRPIYDDSLFYKLPTSFTGHYDIPDGIKSISEYAFEDSKGVTSLSLPKTLEKIPPSCIYNNNKLEKIIVDNNNPFFSSENGVLFNKDKSKLLLVPNGINADSYRVPYGVKIICRWAIFKTLKLKKIHIPPTVQLIERGAINIAELQELYIFNREYERIMESNAFYDMSYKIASCVLFLPTKSHKYFYRGIAETKCTLKGTYENYYFVEDDPKDDEPYVPF